MRADDVKPWALLFSKLRRSDDARVSYDEVLAAGAEPVLMVRERILEYGKDDGYEPAGCEHGCTPNFDYDTRKKDRLVGVACPNDPACWPGWTWVARTEVEGLRCRAKDVFTALAARNGLEPLTVAVPPRFVGVGLLRRRGLSVPVVWLRSATRGFEQLCRGLRAQLGHDALIVLVARNPRVPFAASEKIAPLELLDEARGDLGLVRALEELTPDYRTRVIADQTMDLDYVKVRFATRPGDRHVVEIGDDRRYLIWKIREAEKGRIPVGPRKTRERNGEPIDVKILPLRLEAEVVERMDEAWRTRGIKNRMEFFRRALGHYLSHLRRGCRSALHPP